MKTRILALALASMSFAAQSAEQPLSRQEAGKIFTALSNDIYLPTFHCLGRHGHGGWTVSGEWQIVDSSVRRSQEIRISDDKMLIDFSVGGDRYLIQGEDEGNIDADTIHLNVIKNGTRIARYEDLHVSGLDVVDGIFYVLENEGQGRLTEVTDVSLGLRCDNN